MITQTELKSILKYDDESGQFFWIESKKGRRGTPQRIRKDGYCFICINGKKYLAHRLAWLYMYGKFPQVYIDHINTNKSDNRIINLRLATHSNNGINRGLQANNKSGYKGVHLDKNTNLYMARITINRKMIYLGLFESIENAAIAYKNAAIKYHKEFINMNGVIQ